MIIFLCSLNILRVIIDFLTDGIECLVFCKTRPINASQDMGQNAANHLISSKHLV